MKLLQGLLITSLALSIAGCCGGKSEPASRWDKDNKDKPPSATATTPAAKPTTPPAATTAPAKVDDKKDDKKTDCKKFATGSVNKAFPAEADGFKRVYKTDKEGTADAEYTKGADKFTAFINFAGDKKGDYAASSAKVAGYPYKTFGKNKSDILVKDCYQLSISSMQLDEAKRKTWLEKFKFTALP